LECLARTIRQEEETKVTEIGKETVKISLCRGRDPITQSPKKLYPTTSRQHKQFQHLAGYKINLQKSLAFLYTKNEQIQNELVERIPFTIASKQSKPRSKLNKGCE
jgi:hypothetical protein